MPNNVLPIITLPSIYAGRFLPPNYSFSEFAGGHAHGLRKAWMNMVVCDAPNASMMGLATIALTLAASGPAAPNIWTKAPARFPLPAGVNIPPAVLEIVMAERAADPLLDDDQASIERTATIVASCFGDLHTKLDTAGRGYALGLGKLALASALDDDEIGEVFDLYRHNERGIEARFSESALREIFPQDEVRATIVALDPMKHSPGTSRFGRVSVRLPDSKTAQDADVVVPTADAVAKDTDTVAVLIAQMQAGGHRVKLKPNLMASTVRIWVHALDLTLESSVKELRLATADLATTNPALQAEVEDRSERYGQTHRLPPVFRHGRTTAAECDAILDRPNVRHIPLDGASRQERADRWSAWVRFLESVTTDGGTFALIPWSHP